MSRAREVVEEAIIRIATECFSQRGYQATTIEDIATRADISRVTFYTYFENKEALLQTIFDRGMRAYQDGLEAILAMPLSRRDTLHQVVAHQVQALTAEYSPLRIFFSEEKTLPPQLAHHVQEFHRRIDRLLEKETQLGIDRGELIDAPPRLLTYAFMGMCNWVYRWYRPDGTITPDIIIETFSHILESGCLHPGSTSRTVTSSDTRFQQLEKAVRDLKKELQSVSSHLHRTAKPQSARTAKKISGTAKKKKRALPKR